VSKLPRSRTELGREEHPFCEDGGSMLPRKLLACKKGKIQISEADGVCMDRTEGAGQLGGLFRERERKQESKGGKEGKGLVRGSKEKKKTAVTKLLPLSYMEENDRRSGVCTWGGRGVPKYLGGQGTLTLGAGFLNLVSECSGSGRVQELKLNLKGGPEKTNQSKRERVFWAARLLL